MKWCPCWLSCRKTREKQIVPVSKLVKNESINDLSHDITNIKLNADSNINDKPPTVRRRSTVMNIMGNCKTVENRRDSSSNLRHSSIRLIKNEN